MLTKHAIMMAAAFGVVAMAGCNRQAETDKGSAVVSVHQALAISDISNMSVTVTGAGIGGTPLVVPLVKNGNQYSAVISSLPVGTDYAFSASARDAATPPVVLYQGAVTGQTIQKNRTANIVINMNQVAAGVGTSNSAPVIDSLSASSLLVTQGDVVSLSATAHDPDLGQTAMMTFGWTTTCGVLGTVTTVAGTDTVRGTSSLSWTAPAVDGACAINLTVTDRNGVLRNVASLTINVNDTTGKGNAKVTALPNSYPVIAGLNAIPVPLRVGVATTLTVAATDPDGDALNYLWTTPCAGTFSAANAASTTFTLTDVAATSCDMTVVVNDGLFPNGAAKGSIANHLVLPVAGPAVAVAGSPVFGFDYQTSDTIKGGDVVGMAIISSQGCTGGSITFGWTATGTVLPVVVTPASLGLDSSFTTAARYTAGVGAEDGAVVTVTVTATCSLAGTVPSTHAFTLAPANSFCATQADGTNCLATLGGNQCVTAASCQGGSCRATASVTCSASTVACQVNACVPSTGLCALSAAPINTACSDGNLCTTGDICNAAGACTASPVVCPASANVCQTATCAPATGLCATAPVANGTVCSDGDGCTGDLVSGADSCVAGACVSGASVSCGAGLMCLSNAGGVGHTCPARACMMSGAAVKVLPPIVSMANGSDGAVWAIGNLFTGAPGYDFGNGTPVASTGSSDLYLAKINPATGLATAAFGFGDAAANDQFATAVAVAGTNVGLLGNFSGEIDFTANDSNSGAGTVGVDYLTTSAAIDFWALFNSAGAPIKSHKVDVGGGSMVAIGTNPTQTAFAVCGKSNKLVPASTSLTGLLSIPAGAGYTNAYTAGNGYDIVVAKIDATGAVLWGRQIGGAGDQTCSSVTIDNNGDVVLTGTYNGTLNFGGATTAFPAVTVAPTNAALYVAKLNSTTGAALLAQSWGTTGVQVPKSLTIDKDNNIVLAGAIAANINFGTIAITNAGLTDAFVVKFTTGLGVTWAKSFGDAVYNQQAYSVATTSSGDVVVAGLYSGTLGALGLTSSSTTNSDAFVATLAAADGTATCTKSYGDAAGGQEIDSITVARTAPGSLLDSVMMSGLYSNGITFGSTTLTTTGAGVAASFIARATP